MAGLSEQEEFELLSLEREKAMNGSAPVAMNTDTFSVPSRPRQFVSQMDRPARMINPRVGERQVPVENPLDRGIYQAGGKVTDVLAGAGLPAEVAAGGGYLANLGLQLGSTMFGGGAGAKLEPAAQKLGMSLMTRALKPDKAARVSGQGETAVKTLLEEGLNVTRGGAEVLRDKVDDLQATVAQILDRYPNATVDKQRVYDALSDSISRATKQGTPQDEVATLNRAVMDFAQHPLLQSSDRIPVKLAQELKQGVWRRLKDPAFAKGVAPSGARDAQKAIGSGLRQGIEDVAPEVGPINAETKKFLDTLKLVETRAGAEGNKNLMGIGAISPSMHNFLAWMLDRYPAGKSMLARYFYSHADPEMVGRAAGAALGAQSGQPPRQ